MKIALPEQFTIWFWSVYGRFAWNEHATPSSHVQQITGILTDQTSGVHPRVLDVGCGTGIYSLALAQAGFRVTGIVVASGMLARAYPKVAAAPPAQLQFQQMNLNHPLAFPDQHFDAAIAISTLQAVANPAYTLRELWRVLKPRGVLVVLHAPKPAYHALSLREEVRQRARQLKRKTAVNMILLTVKTWAEQTGGTRYWTVAELHALLEAHQYDVQSIKAGSPILAVAQKSSA